MTDPREWREADIQRLIDEMELESVTLDYKAAEALKRDKKDEIRKDVSAFANSAGGVLIYGVSETTRNGRRVPASIDGVDAAEYGKEWLDQVISKIERKIDGVFINEIPLTGENAGKVVYVVCIPRSHRAPHMGPDHRFYKRSNARCEPMEEYEVRDVSRRQLAPILAVAIDFTRTGDDPTDHREGPEGDLVRRCPIRLALTAENDSEAMAQHAQFRIWIDAQIINPGGWSQLAEMQRVIRWHGRDGALTGLALNHGSTQMPIWKGLPHPLAPLEVAVKMYATIPVVWEALAPGAATRRGVYEVEYSPRNGGGRCQKLNTEIEYDEERGHFLTRDVPT